jgi:cyclophilin family peptidyl-prolyl cis-trans isomerase
VATEKRERQRANRQQRYEQESRDFKRHTRTRRAVIAVVAIVGGVALVLLIAWFFNRSDDDEPTTTTSVAATSTSDGATSTSAGPSTSAADAAGFSYGTGECPPAEGVTAPVTSFADAPQQCIDPAAEYSARFVTDRGDIIVRLDAASQPGTVNNFVTLARSGYYDDTLLFRTNTSIGIVQGGGRDNQANPGYQIPDEGTGFTYQAGQLAMARTQAPNSAGGQWFFTVNDASSGLDTQGTYVVFGEVTEGLDVLEEVLALAGPDGDTPTEDVVLETVEVTES